MNDSSLACLPFNQGSGNPLRALFKQYLQKSDQDEALTWESLTTDNGLPHNWIYDIYQDSQDRMWVGTWGGGLACLEDDHWQVFTRTDGLHCNQVTCIREDPQGKIWIATDEGLNAYQDGRILDSGLKGKSLLTITFDRQGDLWAGCWRATRTGGGLFRYRQGDWQTFSSREKLPGNEILKVFEDSRGQIWVGTYEHGMGAGVGCYDGRRWRSYNRKDGLLNDCVYSMFEDPVGNLWFGTIGGVSIYDGKKWHRLTKKDGLVDDRVYCMMIDSHQKMWFGTEGGVSRFDSENWISYTQGDGLVENLVRAIVETQDGSLWFGTYPYARGRGGISIARYQDIKQLPDRLLDLLPEPPETKKLSPGEEVDF